MTKTEYAEYLQSDGWKAFRSQHLEVVRSCERCNMPRWIAEITYDQDLHLHHKSYRNRGHEKHEDMEVLCRRCHEVETFGRSELKAPKLAKCAVCGDGHFDYRSDLCPVCLAILYNAHVSRIANLGNPFDTAKCSVAIAGMLCVGDAGFIGSLLDLVAQLAAKGRDHEILSRKIFGKV